MNPTTDSSLRKLGLAWLDSLRRHGYSLRTVASYEATLLNLQRYLKRRHIMDARHVKRSDLEAWQQALGQCQPTTQEQFTRTVGYWFKWLAKQGMIFRNPAEELKIVKPPFRLVRCPSETEMKRLLRSIKGTSPLARRDRAMLETAYGTGARLGELARLQVSSVHLDTGLVSCGFVYPATAATVDRNINGYTILAEDWEHRCRSSY